MVSGEITIKSKKAVKKYILPVIKLTAKTGLRPNFFTLTSFISGLLSIYFLFNNNLLFAIFSVIAIIFDTVDGNLARYLKVESKLGFYLDQGNDRTINFLLFLKYILIFGKYWFILPMYILHYALFFIFKTKEVMYVRTFIVIFFIIGGFFYKAYNWGMIGSIILLSVGIILQIFEFWKRRKNIGKKYFNVEKKSGGKK